MRNLLNCERPSPDFTSFKNGEKPRLQKHLFEGKVLRIASCLNLFFVPIWSIILPNQPTFKHFFIVPNLQEWNLIKRARKYDAFNAIMSKRTIHKSFAMLSQIFFKSLILLSEDLYHFRLSKPSVLSSNHLAHWVECGQAAFIYHFTTLLILNPPRSSIFQCCQPLRLLNCSEGIYLYSGVVYVQPSYPTLIPPGAPCLPSALFSTFPEN